LQQEGGGEADERMLHALFPILPPPGSRPNNAHSTYAFDPCPSGALFKAASAGGVNIRDLKLPCLVDVVPKVRSAPRPAHIRWQR
jgi:hypothetical protein